MVMNPDEKIAKTYLESLGFSNIVYEPDGNIPPDFLVDGRIAVEVRRLNKQIDKCSGKSEGLEQVFFSTVQRMEKLLLTLGPSLNGESWFVNINFARPLENWRTLQLRIRQILVTFMRSDIRRKMSVEITEHFQIDIVPARTLYPSFFELGEVEDHDDAGWVIPEVMKSLGICIAEKNCKTASNRWKYPEWWLVLPDHIAYGLSHESQKKIREIPLPPHDWQKIILLHPSRPQYAFEIYSM